MEGLKCPTVDLLSELGGEGATPVVSEDELRKAEQDINQKMEIFSTELRSYFSRSIESARRAYITS